MSDDANGSTDGTGTALGGDAGNNNGDGQGEGQQQTALGGDAGAGQQNAGGGDDAGGQGGNGDGNGSGDGQPTGAPEKYEAFKVPEGLSLEGEQLQAFEALAKEANMTQDAAQAALDMGAKAVQDAMSAADQAYTDQVAGWLDASKKLPDLGGENFDKTIAECAAVFDAAGDVGNELRAALNETGMGNHPAMIKFVHQFHQFVKEGQFIDGAQSGDETPRDAAQILYGSTPNGQQATH